MESKASDTEYEATKTGSIDWAESEWFQVWMQLSRRVDDKARTRSQGVSPNKEITSR